jgi:thioredoxin reductase (NADPH)
MDRPILMALVDRGDVLESLRQDLTRRYGADYDVIAETSTTLGLEILERLHGAGRSLAVVIAAQWMPHLTGADFLARVHQHHPRSRRMLLTRVFDQTINEPLGQAMALGRLDSWLLEPWDPAEEYLYAPITEQLVEWIRSTPGPALPRWMSSQNPDPPVATRSGTC